MPNKLSALKKKMLMERWKNALPDGTDLPLPPSSSSNNVSLGYLFIVNYMSTDDLLEKEEVDEIVSELIELIKPHTTGIGTDGGVKQIVFSEDKCVLRVTLACVEYATAASQFLNGLVIGGQQLYTWVTSTGHSKWLAHATAQTAAAGPVNDETAVRVPVQAGQAEVEVEAGANHVDVRLLNVLFEDDIPDVSPSESGENNSEGGEEVKEMLADVMDLCRQTCREEVLSVSFVGKHGRRGSTADAGPKTWSSGTKQQPSKQHLEQQSAVSSDAAAERVPRAEPRRVLFLEDIGGRPDPGAPLVLVELSKGMMDGGSDAAQGGRSSGAQSLLKMFELFRMQSSHHKTAGSNAHCLWLRAPQGSGGHAGSACLNLHQLQMALIDSKGGVGKYSVGIKLHRFVDSSSEVATLPVRDSGADALSAVGQDDDVAAEYAELVEDCVSILQTHAEVNLIHIGEAQEASLSAGLSAEKKSVEYRSVRFVRTPTTGGGAAPSALDAVVVLSSLEDCCSVVDTLFRNDRVLAGSLLHADIVLLESSDMVTAPGAGLSVLASDRVHSLHSTRRTAVNSSFSLFLQALGPDFVRPASEPSAEYIEVNAKREAVRYLNAVLVSSPLTALQETVSAVRYYPNQAAVTAPTAPLTAPLTTADRSSSSSTTHSSSRSRSMVTTVCCRSYQSALNVILALDGVVMGGQMVAANIIGVAGQSKSVGGGKSKGKNKGRAGKEPTPTEGAASGTAGSAPAKRGKVRSLWQTQLLASKYTEAASFPKLPKHNSLTMLPNASTNVVNNNSYLLSTQHIKVRYRATGYSTALRCYVLSCMGIVLRCVVMFCRVWV